MKHKKGFTLVELMVVIIVIGILATITVVTFNGAQQRARTSALVSDMKQVSKQLEVYKATKGAATTYPTSLPGASITVGTSASYIYNPSSDTTSYCVSAKSLVDPTLVYSMSNTSDGPVAGSSLCATGATNVIASSDNPPNEDKLKAFDGTSSTKWLAFATTAWIIFSTSSQTTPTTYSITSANDTPTRDPKSWTLYGSNDRTTWVALDSQTNQTFSNRYVTNTYAITGAGAYLHFKLDITQHSGDSLTQLSEITVGGTSGNAVIINQ